MFLLFDVMLAMIVLLVALMLVRSASLLHATILFIVFGVLVALVWVRLNAPDAALAEAAIGAGLTGALLLATLAQLDTASKSGRSAPKSSVGRVIKVPVVLLGLAVLATAGLFFGLIPALFGQADAPALTGIAYAHLEQSGVSHPVTAVLLSYRAWDTLLELAVLLLALIGARAVGAAGQMRPEPVAGPVLATATRIITPVMMMVGLYLLWLGSHAPGGAFQAGAVLAASLVLYWLAFPQAVQALPEKAIEALVLVGLSVFLVAGLLASLSGLAFLQWPQQFAYAVILFIEIAAMLSIAMTLALLFAANLKTNPVVHRHE